MVEPMRIVAILSGMLVQRITRNTHRIANSDGIIVINVAEGLRNTSRNARKMTLPVSTKLSARVGRRRCVICVARTPWPATLPRTERSEERRVGKSVDLGGRRIIKKKKKEQE